MTAPVRDPKAAAQYSGSGPRVNNEPNVATRLLEIMKNKKLKTDLLPQILKACQLEPGASNNLTAIVQAILTDKKKESALKKILDREAPENQKIGRKRAQSTAAPLRQSQDQYQLGLAVEAMCDGLETNRYLLQWLEAFLKASGCSPKVSSKATPLERVEAIKRAFQRVGDRWDGVLVESVKTRIVVASGNAKVREGSELICGDKGKSRRITAPEALALCLNSSMTPHFGSHTIEQHRALLELMVRDLSQNPIRAKTLEPHVCGVANHLKVRLLREGDFAAFALPDMGLEEATLLSKIGFYQRVLVINTSSEAPLPLSQAGGTVALVIDGSHEVKGPSITGPTQKKHAAFHGSLMTVDCNTLYFKGCAAQLGLYPDLLRKVSHLWVELDEITTESLTLLQTLPRCTTLHITTSANAEGPFLEYKLLTKLIAKAPNLQHLVVCGATFTVASARTKDTWQTALHSLNVSVSLQEKPKESAAKGALQFTANTRTIADLNLHVRYPSIPVDIMQMPPNLESGTQTAAVRTKAFDQQVEIEGECYQEALHQEKQVLELLLQQLDAGKKRRPFVGLYVPTWPEACNPLLPAIATELKLRVDRVIDTSNPTPIKWPEDTGELHYRGPLCGTLSNWLGTTDAFVEKGIPVLAFTHGKMTTEQLKQLEAELSEMDGVKELNLSYNSLDSTALSIVHKLIESTRLLRLDLRGNPLDQIAAQQSAKPPSDVPPPLPKARPTTLPRSAVYGHYDQPVDVYEEVAYVKLGCGTTKQQNPQEGLYDVETDTTAPTGAGSTAKPPSPRGEDSKEYVTLEEMQAKTKAPENPLYAPLEDFQEAHGKAVRSFPGLRANLHTPSFAPSAAKGERTFEVGEEAPPTPPNRLSLTAQAQEPEENAYEDPQELGLSLLLQKIASCDYLVYLDISGCGWNPAMLKALPQLQHLRELGIGNADCNERGHRGYVAALEQTNVRHLHVPVGGALKEKISDWNLRRAQQDPTLQQSEA